MPDATGQAHRLGAVERGLDAVAVVMGARDEHQPACLVPAGCAGATRAQPQIGQRIADLEQLRARFVEEGTFIRPFGSIVYLTPAFTIEEDELAKLTSTIVRVVGSAPG